MARSLSLLLVVVAAAVGLTAAFFRPAVPHQVTGVPRGGDIFETKPEPSNVAFVDVGLDNPDIEEDGNIHPARKCGFCMG
mmetsp:Transcript_34379/g.63569  ORF Transcript_34379/g.63569 Transcript_34379/m.63569 type:complete len:80 (-) Transcript_34379:524-763(-)|eukprot:CAMPEP_0197437660 /NCGR_PEP_ID=MMETSP1175-20131217/4854_1 /TAXON_ID=1003142 /ORGANISM="Triceratium dubium, Strain CCMP147" /LENGTH=79 /DNA_ID=CAMNT_0042967237 /DNA_START=46 /DNA_END=285 /DNA_ORIENTATION=+